MHQFIRKDPWVIVAMAFKTFRGQWRAQCWICKGATPHSSPQVLGGHHDSPEAAVEAARICGQMAIAETPVESRTDVERHAEYLRQWTPESGSAAVS